MALKSPKQSQALRIAWLSAVSTLLGLAVLFAIAEAGFRIAGAVRHRFMDPRKSKPSWIVYDPDLGYRMPNLPFAVPKRGLFRVVVLGDSLIGWSREDSMVGRIQRLASGFSELLPCEFINTGVPGYTNYQELAYLRKYGLALQPDLVGVVFCLNDVHKFLQNPRFVNDRLVWNSFGEFTPEAIDSMEGFGNGPLLRLARRSAFLSFLLYKVALAGAKVRMQRHSGYEFDYRIDLSTAWQDSEWIMIKDQMTEMAELARGNHFRLFLVVVPIVQQYRPDYLARDRNYVLKPQRRLGEISASLKIPYLDLLPYLNSEAFQSDGLHLNSEGNQRAAERIAEFLRAEHLLPVR